MQHLDPNDQGSVSKRNAELIVREQNLPYHIGLALQNLPEQVQTRFLGEYASKKKNLVIAYLLHILIPPPFTPSYAYLGKWGKQFLFSITSGGLYVWWAVNLFRLPDLVRKKNASLAEALINKYGEPRYLKKMGIAPPNRRETGIAYDPSTLTPANLATGFMFDYNLKTWDVRSTWQLDWSNGETEIETHVSSELEKAVVHVKTSSIHQTVTFGNEISLTLLNLQAHTLDPVTIPNALQYQGKTFHLDRKLKGYAFAEDQQAGKPAMLFYYLDPSRIYYIRIYQVKEESVAYVGREIQPELISEILPSS